MDLRVFPGAQTFLAVARRPPVRRPEADAVDRTRHRRTAKTVVDRRADQGSRAGDRGGAYRMLCRGQTPRRYHLAGRAEFPCRARARRRGSGDGQRQNRPSRRDGGAGFRDGPAGAPAGLEPGGASMTDLAASTALPKPNRDILPALLPVIVALAMLPLIGSASSWVTLTVASLAMGMMIFIMASGLTLVFGLMDVLNFGHGAFIAVGAYVATLVLLPLASWVQADSLLANLAVLAPAALLSMAVTGALGLVVERVLILPVYGQHLKQILMTTGGLIVAEQALYALWGPQIIPLPLPTSLRGSFIIGDIAIAKYRLLGMLVGLIVFCGIQLVLNRTKIGLLIRAGVEYREMGEAIRYRIRRLFLGVIMTGSGLAGLGGVMWALYREQVHASMGNDLTVLVFIVVIIGGLRSLGALLFLRPLVR